MRKIEKLDIGYNEDAMRPMLNKINELVDAVNKLFEWTGGFEQTQEPESKPCHWCGAVGDEEHGCGVPEKEPECKHDRQLYTGGNGKKYCSYCNSEVEEKPAKKECEQHLPMADKDGHPHCANCGRYSYDHEPKKDELAERLEKKSMTFGMICDEPTVKWQYEQLADEARKWAVEQLDSASLSLDVPAILYDAILSRLKESK